MKECLSAKTTINPNAWFIVHFSWCVFGVLRAAPAPREARGRRAPKPPLRMGKSTAETLRGSRVGGRRREPPENPAGGLLAQRVVL